MRRARRSRQPIRSRPFGRDLGRRHRRRVGASFAADDAATARRSDRWCAGVAVSASSKRAPASVAGCSGFDGPTLSFSWTRHRPRRRRDDRADDRRGDRRRLGRRLAELARQAPTRPPPCAPTSAPCPARRRRSATSSPRRREAPRAGPASARPQPARARRRRCGAPISAAATGDRAAAPATVSASIDNRFSPDNGPGPPTNDEARHLQGRLARRPARRRLARPRAAPTMPAASPAACSRCSTTGTSSRRSCRTCRRRSTTARRATRSRSSRSSAWRRCRAPTSGPTARPSSTTSSWCARRATPRCRRASTTDPLMYQGGSDDFLGPCDDIVAASTDWGIDFEAEVAVVTGDVAMGTSAEAALDGDPPGDAGQRREPAQPDPGRARQGLRLLPEQAGDGVQPGRGDARRARREPGAAAACTSTSRAPGTARASAAATPARR